MCSTLLGCGGGKAAAPAVTTPVAKADPCVVGPFVVSSSTANGGKPAVASRRDEFAVVWEEAGEQARRIELRVFDAHGGPLTPTLLVTKLPSGGGDPRIAATDDGYAIVWAVDRDGTSAVVLQRTDARGVPAGAPLEAFSSPTARPLALAPSDDGLVVVWWQWAVQPHVERATWLDARGARAGEVELTRSPCDDPTADVRRAADGRLRVAWEEQRGDEQRVLAGLLSKDRIVQEGPAYVGRDPALLRDGVVMTAVPRSAVLYAPFGAAEAVPLASGRMKD